jgi:hypothetical protein
VALGLKASASLTSAVTPVESRNVVGCCAAPIRARPALAEEWLVLCAHWDHFGKTRRRRATTSSTRGRQRQRLRRVLALARALAKADPKPARSTLVLFVTGEERGLLGSQWYADHPLVPLARQRRSSTSTA